MGEVSGGRREGFSADVAGSEGGVGVAGEMPSRRETGMQGHYAVRYVWFGFGPSVSHFLQSQYHTFCKDYHTNSSWFIF